MNRFTWKVLYRKIIFIPKKQPIYRYKTSEPRVGFVLIAIIPFTDDIQYISSSHSRGYLMRLISTKAMFREKVDKNVLPLLH